MKSSQGFTLLELMIVMVIAGLLFTFAIPAYTDHITRSKRADAHGALLDIAARQERFMAQNNTYTTEIAGGTGLNLGSNESNEGYYDMSVAACGTGIRSCYTITASAKGAQASDSECQTITYDSRGVKGGSSANCW